jgi:elongation factor P
MESYLCAKFFEKNMATTADIRNGLCIRHNEKLFQIIEFQHVKPGKGPAFVRTKMRQIESGKVLDNTFSAGHKIDVVRIERREYQYLYQEGENYIFMNNETYEQVEIPAKMIEKPLFLKEGMICEITFHAEEEMPLVVDLPNTIEAEVTYTEPGIKGDTATNTMKPATIDTGAEIRVPLFIGTGEKIKVDTRTGVYVERVK